MDRRTASGVLLCIVAAFSSSALAQISAFWEQVTITPAAIANDPTLASMQSWDLIVMTTGDWASAAMRAALPPGLAFYKHPLGGLTRPDPAIFGSSPALEFTTYVSAPSDDGTNHDTRVLGGHPQGSLLSIGDPTSAVPGTFSMSWGSLECHSFLM